jgi:anti-sigma factor ChrR (cupin superfamily)
MAESNENQGGSALPQDVLGALFGAIAARGVVPSQEARIRRRIDAGLLLEPATTRLLAEGNWQRVGDDLQIKIVNFDAQSGLHSYLLRMQPGATIGAHRHRRSEECVIVSGTVQVDGQTYGVGDYQLFQPGTRHSAIHSADGALLFLRAELELNAGA